MITISSTSAQLSRLIRTIAGFNLLVLGFQLSPLNKFARDGLPRDFIIASDTFVSIWGFASIPILLMLAMVVLWRHVRGTSRRTSTDLAIDLGLVGACSLLAMFFVVFGYFFFRG